MPHTPPAPRPAPARVLFLVTSLPVGGAEKLLVELVRRLDRRRFAPEVCCLKQPGVLGGSVTPHAPLHHGLTAGRLDPWVLPRLVRLMRRRRVEAVATVGAGDKMFWGRIAARLAGVPVVVSALHSTGWPDGVGRLNRLLTPMTDAFIAVAAAHGHHLIRGEGFPADRVKIIPNGVDTDLFQPRADRSAVRAELGVPADAAAVAVVAALRPEKNHELFLAAAAGVADRVPGACFLVVGDGPRLEDLRREAGRLGIDHRTHFLGCRDDVPRVLGAVDVVALTSHNEANPVSILEAMSVGLPVVATDVGSLRESVRDGVTGHLVAAGDLSSLVDRLTGLLRDPVRRGRMGVAARRQVLRSASLELMLGGYEELLGTLLADKAGRVLPAGERGANGTQAPAPPGLTPA